MFTVLGDVQYSNANVINLKVGPTLRIYKTLRFILLVRLLIMITLEIIEILDARRCEVDPLAKIRLVDLHVDVSISLRGLRRVDLIRLLY